MPKYPVKVYLTASQRRTLTKIAKDEESSCSEILRNAFILYRSELVKNPTLSDVLSELNKQ